MGALALPHGFQEDAQSEFRKAQEEFFQRVSERAKRDPDVPAAALLAPDCRWNNLISAIGTYISGAELDRVSARDFDNFDDTGVNWRIVEGYGATIAKYGEGVPAILDCPVQRIDHQGKRLKIETSQGAIVADQAIVTFRRRSLPSHRAAVRAWDFRTKLKPLVACRWALPTNYSYRLKDAEEFDKDCRLFGATDRTATATYHCGLLDGRRLRFILVDDCPLTSKRAAHPRFSSSQCPSSRENWGVILPEGLKPIHIHCWGADPFAARLIFICVARQGGLPHHARRSSG